MTTRGTVLPNGIRLETPIEHEKLWQRMIKHYGEGSNHYLPNGLWKCPWCGGDIDSLDGERNNETFEDTYTCVGDCELMITFITPAEIHEYHEVPNSDWKVLVESSRAIEWYAPEEADDPIDDDTERAAPGRDGG